MWRWLFFFDSCKHLFTKQSTLLQRWKVRSLSQHRSLRIDFIYLKLSFGGKYIHLCLSFWIHWSILSNVDRYPYVYSRENNGSQSIILDFSACQPTPCKNGAQCYVVGTTDYACACSSRYTGRQCETVVCKFDLSFNFIQSSSFIFIEASCSSSYCSNGGTCVVMSDGVTYKCACPTGYTGDRCTSYVNSKFFCTKLKSKWNIFIR